MLNIIINVCIIVGCVLLQKYQSYYITTYMYICINK